MTILELKAQEESKDQVIGRKFLRSEQRDYFVPKRTGYLRQIAILLIVPEEFILITANSFIILHRKIYGYCLEYYRSSVFLYAGHFI